MAARARWKEVALAPRPLGRRPSHSPRPCPRSESAVNRCPAVRRAPLAQRRATPCQPDPGSGGAPQPAVHLLHGGGERRCVEDDRCRPHVEADLRRPADGLDRHHRDRALGRRRSSTSAAAKGCTGRTCRLATASTSRPTLARHGRTSACATRSRFRTSRSIRRNPDRLFVAALGHPVRSERGTRHLSLDRRRKDVPEGALSKDENTGGNDVDIDPSNPDIVYATMWEERQGPWENSVWAGTGGGIFKSTDGGATWKPLTNGLPAVVQANIAISPANPEAAVCDGGRLRRARHEQAIAARRHLSQRRRGRDVDADHDRRPSGRTHRRRRSADADSASEGSRHRHRRPARCRGSRRTAARRGRRSRARPAARTIRTAGSIPTIPTSSCSPPTRARSSRSTAARRGAPGTTSRPAQFYHVSADNAFPYRVCSGQQENGSVVRVEPRQLRRDLGPRLAPGRRRRVRLRRARSAQSRHRLRRPHGDAASIGEPARCRSSARRRARRRRRRAGQLPSGADDAGDLFRGGQACALLRQQPPLEDDRRRHPLEADQPRPDAHRRGTCRRASASIASQPTAQPAPRGVIYTVAPSYQDINRIWVGTDDGLIHVTADDGGATWKDVTPPARRTVGESVGDGRRAGSSRSPPTPRSTRCASTICVRTSSAPTMAARPGPRSSTAFPSGETVNAVREDPKRKGLLFAGTERAVYVSFDDGANWQSLRLNMAVSSVRDLDRQRRRSGRGDARPRILDSRRHHAAAPDRCRVGDAGRRSCSSRRRPGACAGTRASTCRGPRKKPTAPNPPEGAIINYYLKAASSGPITLEILQPDGRLVRRYSSDRPSDAAFPIRRLRRRRSTGTGQPQRPFDRSGDAPLRRGTFTISRSPGWFRVTARLAPCRRSCRFRRSHSIRCRRRRRRG